jgi:hypothetical protein
MGHDVDRVLVERLRPFAPALLNNSLDGMVFLLCPSHLNGDEVEMVDNMPQLDEFFEEERRLHIDLGEIAPPIRFVPIIGSEIIVIFGDILIVKKIHRKFFNLWMLSLKKKETLRP